MLSFFNIDTYFSDPATEEAVITTVSGSRTVKCHFFNPYEQQKMNDFAYEGDKPSVEVATSDVLDAKAGNVLRVRGVDYKLREKKPSDEGITIWELSYD